MKTSELKEKLHRYIDTAKTDKLKAIYTMLEDDIELRVLMEAPELYNELDRRRADVESGKLEESSWEEVEERVSKLLKTVKPKK